jgi:hypothetical protein
MTTPRMRAVVGPLGALTFSVVCVSAFSVGTASAAIGPVSVGSDVSWPQCGSALPVRDFGIVGVNDGKPGTANPCLSSELSWAAGTPGPPPQPKVALYVNTDDPGDASGGSLVSDWPSSGNTPYGACTTTTVMTSNGTASAGDNTDACAWYYGAQEANQDLAWLGGASSTYQWWLDVETGNAWQANDSMNMAALQGMVQALIAGRAPTVGVYSTGYQWGQITGGGAPGNLNGLPVWLPGASDPTGAEANCFASSFTGGPVGLTQWTDDFDEDVACGPVPATLAPPALSNTHTRVPRPQLGRHAERQPAPVQPPAPEVRAPLVPGAR